MNTEAARRTRQTAAVAGSLIVVVVIIWIDVTTAIWQEVVILSGLAAGLVTFLLTVVVLDRVLANNTARRWAPINRLAVTEFLHAIVDDDASEIAHGRFVPRSLGLPTQLQPESLATLRDQVVQERRALSDALSRWTSFLASSGDNEDILLHIADIALHLDLVRDAALEAELRGDANALSELRTAVSLCNKHSAALVDELRGRLAVPSKLATG
ncbi:hypothetical protein [Leucobacter salsicius]|uniref:hypothetical protein n=1 Tax=Leucobacter salsicius TaxID=664638 RepID=UPI00034569EC|nr:hypothetical protein [Leucobacter salsicius]